MLILSVAGVVSQPLFAGQDEGKEYLVKAAFLYNFINFANWPEKKLHAADKEIRIGVIGKNPFENSLDKLKEKDVGGKRLEITLVPSFNELADKTVLKNYHVLFICASEQSSLGDILEILKDSGTLTVADTDGFLEAGGVINFVIKDQKVKFEVNLVAAKKEELQLRATLLRLADRVIQEKKTAS